jgi:DNA-binding LytR/AlgR family response regulator
MNEDDFIKRIVSDLYLVAKHVAAQPRGYAGFEVERAKVLLHTVDVEALSDTLNSVLYVSWYLTQSEPLTEAESQVEQAARRLDKLQRTIRMNQSQIQSRMAA